MNPGWYSWNVTALVRAQVRGEQANFGVVLRDATGYEDDHIDWRTFVSSQHPQHPKRRPKLVVSYNPDTPYANAGPDQEQLSWNGGALTLDGSGSRDRPGGDDAGLHYQWSILKAAYGSTMGGDLASGPDPTISFTPDACGEWEIRLVVTNTLGESASDTVRLRLLQIPAGHPRIYLTPAKLADLRGRAIDSNPRWVQLKNEALSEDGEMHAKALVSQISGDPATCLQAVNAALDLIAEPDNWSTKAGDIALVYDWCHAQLTAGQRTVFIDYLNDWAQRGITEPYANDVPGWGNYWPRYGYSYALAGLATYGDNPRAAEWLDEYRHRRYRDHDLPLLNRIAAGGGWPEGMIYDWIANWPRVKALEAWRSATGENLFASTSMVSQPVGLHPAAPLAGGGRTVGKPLPSLCFHRGHGTQPGEHRQL